MIRLDTTKFTFPIDALNQYDANKYNEHITNKSTGELESWKLILNKDHKPPGIKNIEVHESAIIVELSAKVLQDKYLEGININTIEQAINRMRQTGCVDIDTNKAIESGQILRCDVTNTTYFTEDDFDLLKIGFMASINDKRISIDNYDRRGNKGMVLNGLYRTKDERMIIYPKDDEMKPTKRNKAYFDTLLDPGKMLDKMRNMKRVESNLKTQKAIRDQLKTNALWSTPILHILESETNVNYNAIDTYIKVDPERLAFMNEYNDMKISDEIKLLGIMGIIERCLYDPDIVKAYLKKRIGAKNWQRKWDDHFKPNMAKLQLGKKGNSNKIVSLINDFKNQLKAI